MESPFTFTNTSHYPIGTAYPPEVLVVTALPTYEAATDPNAEPPSYNSLFRTFSRQFSRQISDRINISSGHCPTRCLVVFCVFLVILLLVIINLYFFALEFY